MKCEWCQREIKSGRFCRRHRDAFKALAEPTEAAPSQREKVRNIVRSVIPQSEREAVAGGQPPIVTLCEECNRGECLGNFCGCKCHEPQPETPRPEMRRASTKIECPICQGRLAATCESNTAHSFEISGFILPPRLALMHLLPPASCTEGDKK